MLVFLLEHRNRVVTKDELIRAVWEDVAVTDDTIVQSVMEIRRALGESARLKLALIKTIAKSGYRFIGRVEECSSEAGVVIQTRQSTTVEVEFEEEFNEDSRLQGDLMSRRAELLTPVVKSPHRDLALAAITVASVVLLGVAGFFTLRALRTTPSTAEVTLPQVVGRKAVAVIYFDNQSASADLDWLRQGLPDMIITGLSRSEKADRGAAPRQQLLPIDRKDGPQTW